MDKKKTVPEYITKMSDSRLETYKDDCLATSNRHYGQADNYAAKWLEAVTELKQRGVKHEGTL